jgi:ABC-type transporter Mla maintaining outer membrane lipid asymmetry ATPase subunit MlaF
MTLRRRMGMLFQNSALLTDFSVFENVAFPVRENTRLHERLLRNAGPDQAAFGRSARVPRI